MTESSLRDWRVFRVAALAGFAFTFSPEVRAAEADPAASIALRWEAPAGCPTRERVLDDVRSLATRSDAGSPKGPVAVDARVERLADDRFRLTLAVGAGRRRLEASTCARIARAAALLVALVIDPSSVEPPSEGPPADAPAEGSPEHPPAPGVPPAPPPPPAPEAVRPSRPLSDWCWFVATGLLIETGTLPRAELLGALEVGLRYGRLELALQGGAGLPQDTSGSGQAGARLRIVDAALTPCYIAIVVGHFRVGPCTSAEVGWVHAEGMGVSQGQSTDAAWLSLGGELRASWAFGRHLEARLAGGALMPVVRPDFELSGYPLSNRTYATGSHSLFEPGLAVHVGALAIVRF